MASPPQSAPAWLRPLPDFIGSSEALAAPIRGIGDKLTPVAAAV